MRDGYNVEELKDKLDEAGLEPVRAIYTYGVYGSLAWRMLIKTPMRLLGVSRLFLAMLPFYYLLVLPIGLVLHILDVRTHNETGTGLIVIARKPAS